MWLIGGCAAAADDRDDSEAESADVQTSGKADAAAVLGLYHSHASRHYNGDVPDLELRDADYVRARCYHASCALRVPETSTYDVYTSSSGKTYVRFGGEAISHDADGNLVETHVVADVYEIKTWSGGIKLRKSYSTRWQVLYRTTVQTACTSSGGTFGTECTCPTSTFAAGAGGCIAMPGANESNCDDSGGAWTDDDATAIGSYCVCSVGQYLDGTGACSAI
jgi:hypothetical protein